MSSSSSIKNAESKAILKKLFPDLSDSLAHLCLANPHPRDPYLYIAKFLLDRSPHQSSKDALKVIKENEEGKLKIRQPIGHLHHERMRGHGVAAGYVEAAPVAPYPLDLPLFYKHASHDHELWLLSKVYGDGVYSCNQCNTEGSGQVYHCAACQYDLHPKCCSFPPLPPKLPGALTKSGLVNRSLGGIARTNLPPESHGNNPGLYSPLNAFDSSYDSIWVSVTHGVFDFPHHLSYFYPFNQRYCVVEYAIAGHPYEMYNNQSPSAWTLSGSNDNENWTVVDKQINQKFTCRTLNVYSIRNADKYGPFKAYKFAFTANNGWVGSPVVVISHCELRCRQ